MTTRTPKQTAGNNAFLAKVKRTMNVPTFKATAAILNAEGEDAARAHVQAGLVSPLDEALDRMIATLDAGKGA